jgi:hypothetical protein
MTVNLSALAGAGQQFFDNNGNPLTGGKLYSYEAGTTTPQTTYTNASGSTAHTNPIILDSAGRVPGGEIWLTAGETYKFVLKTSAEVTLATWDNITGINGTGITSNAATVVYDPAGTGAVATNVQAKLRESVSVLDFGADSTGTADSSTAISNAIATGKSVYFPAGTYLCNVNINTKTILFGDGSTASIIRPYSYLTPAMIYTFAAQQNPVFGYWNYHSEVRNLGFKGTGTGASATGIGFSFGSSGPSNYVSGAEYANNVTFYNCFFSNLEKGVQFPFGNIGSSFYSCGFQGNYYGIYMLNNKSGSGDDMHAGNKYFYNGEISSNTVGVYINNTQDGFGGVNFTDTIIEYNNIGVYVYNTASSFTPIQFNDCWNEGNGLLSGGPSSVTVDVWTGSVKTTTSADVYFCVLYNDLTLINGGFASGISLTKNNARVNVKNTRVETSSSFAGQPNNITYGDSNIFFENCISSSGYSSSAGYSGNVQCVGFNASNFPSSKSSGFTVGSRFRFLPVSYAVRTGSGLQGVSEKFITAQTYGGASSGTGTLVTSGTSPKYTNYNQFTFTFASTAQYYAPTNTAVSVVAGTWIAFTCDIFLVSAGSAIAITFSDLSLNNAGRIVLGVESVWRTIGGVAYIPDGANLALWFETIAAPQTAVINVSAFQCKYFATQGEAENFLASRTYVE